MCGNRTQNDYKFLRYHVRTLFIVTNVNCAVTCLTVISSQYYIYIYIYIYIYSIFIIKQTNEIEKRDGQSELRMEGRGGSNIYTHVI